MKVWFCLCVAVLSFNGVAAPFCSGNSQPVSLDLRLSPRVGTELQEIVFDAQWATGVVSCVKVNGEELTSGVSGIVDWRPEKFGQYAFTLETRDGNGEVVGLESSVLMVLEEEGGPYTEIVNGITWTFMVNASLEASVGSDAYGVTAVPASTIGDISIPTTLGGRPVTGLGESSFCGCNGITSVEIPSSVRTMGDRAFGGCVKLTNVTVPSSVREVGESAFEDCRLLKIVTIEDGVEEIRSYAFSGCESLENVIMPSSITNVGQFAFVNCARLRSVTIPPSIRCIEYNTFRGCVGLMEVVISLGVTDVGKCAFYGCTGLTNVTIPSSVTNVGTDAFYGCEAVKNVCVPGWRCGINFEAVTNMVVSMGTTTIRDSAFWRCHSLTSVTIPQTVMRIGDDAFWLFVHKYGSRVAA